MTLLMLPAFCALLLKALVIIWVDIGKQSATFMALFFVLAIQNLCEVLAYFQFLNGVSALYLVKAYYATCLFGLAYMFLYCIEVTQKTVRKSLFYLSMALATALSILIIATNVFVSDAESIGYSLTAVQGDFFMIIRFVFVGQILMSGCILFYGAVFSSDPNIQKQSFYTFMALSPIVLVGMGVNISQMMGFKFNASLVLPMATTTFLFLVCYLEPKTKLTRIMMYLPGSLERRLTSRILELTGDYALDGKGFRNTKYDLERLLVEYALEKHSHNVLRTAEAMGIERTTLYSVMRRCGIERPDKNVIK